MSEVPEYVDGNDPPQEDMVFGVRWGKPPLWENDECNVCKNC